jgi:hypothetical protein
VSKLTVEEWDKKFQPVTNPFNKEASWNGVMFETYGEELDYVQCHDEHNVWTLVDSDLGISLVAGYCVVNRIGYFVTEVAWEDMAEILVHDDQPEINTKNKCNKCGVIGNLVMNHALLDEVCEACGQWQEAEYTDVYVKVGN